VAETPLGVERVLSAESEAPPGSLRVARVAMGVLALQTAVGVGAEQALAVPARPQAVQVAPGVLVVRALLFSCGLPDFQEKAF
jgi:hypothetical protein